MKRIISIIIMLALALGLCACGQKEDEPLTWQEQYDLGLHYLSEGDYEQAILAFEAAIDIDPKQAEAYIALAEVYVQQGEPEKAAEILDQAVAEIGQTDELLDAKAALTPPEPQPIPEPSPEAPPEPTPEPTPEVTPEPTPEPTPEVTPEPTPEPTPESTPEQESVRTVRKEERDGSYWIYEYGIDSLDKPTRTIKFNADGTMSYYSAYEYDAAGNQVRGDYYNSDDTLNYYWINEYDAAGNRVRQTRYDPEGNVIKVEEF